MDIKEELKGMLFEHLYTHGLPNGIDVWDETIAEIKNDIMNEFIHQELKYMFSILKLSE